MQASQTQQKTANSERYLQTDSREQCTIHVADYPITSEHESQPENGYD
jgi:hypothetical protein